jgi:hypothetical protein
VTGIIPQQIPAADTETKIWVFGPILQLGRQEWPVRSQRAYWAIRDGLGQLEEVARFNQFEDKWIIM